ncbi:hypothetical protein HK405_008775, partial [Cladochytrium tenue]
MDKVATVLRSSGLEEDYEKRLHDILHTTGASAEIEEFVTNYTLTRTNLSIDSDEGEQIAEDFFRERLEAPPNVTDSEAITKSGDNEEENAETKLVYGREVIFARKILDKCQHFIASDDPEFAAFVIKIIAKTFPLLRKADSDRNQAIHKLWPSLVNRLRSSNHLVILQAMELIKIIALESEDFVKKRAMEDVLPVIEALVQVDLFPTAKVISKTGELIKRDGQLSSTTERRIAVSALKLLCVLARCLPFLKTAEFRRILKVAWPAAQLDMSMGGTISDGVRSAAADVVKAVELRDPDLTNRDAIELKGHQGDVDQLVWDPVDPERLATASVDKTVRIWDVRQPMKARNVIQTQGENINIAWSPDGKTIAVGNK